LPKRILNLDKKFEFEKLEDEGGSCSRYYFHDNKSKKDENKLRVNQNQSPNDSSKSKLRTTSFLHKPDNQTKLAMSQ